MASEPLGYIPAENFFCYGYLDEDNLLLANSNQAYPETDRIISVAGKSFADRPASPELSISDQIVVKSEQVSDFDVEKSMEQWTQVMGMQAAPAEEQYRECKPVEYDYPIYPELKIGIEKPMIPVVPQKTLPFPIPFNIHMPITNFEQAIRLVNRGDVELEILFKQLKNFNGANSTYSVQTIQIPYIFELLSNRNSLISKYLLAFLVNKKPEATKNALTTATIPLTGDNVLHFYSKHYTLNLELFVFEKLLPDVFNELRKAKNYEGKTPLETLVSKNNCQIAALTYQMTPEIEKDLCNQLVSLTEYNLDKAKEYLIPENRYFDFLLIRMGDRILKLLEKFQSDKNELPLEVLLKGYDKRYFGNVLHLAFVIQDFDLINYIKKNAHNYFKSASAVYNELMLTPLKLGKELHSVPKEVITYVHLENKVKSLKTYFSDSPTARRMVSEPSIDLVRKKKSAGDCYELKEWKYLLFKNLNEIHKLLEDEQKVFNIFFNSSNQKYNLCLFENLDRNFTLNLLLKHITKNTYVMNADVSWRFQKRLFKYLFQKDLKTLFSHHANGQNLNKYLIDCEGFKFVDPQSLVYMVYDFDQFKILFKKYDEEMFKCLKNPSDFESLLFNVGADKVLSYLIVENHKKLEEIILVYSNSKEASCANIIHFGVVLKNLRFLMLLKSYYPKLFENYRTCKNNIGLTPLAFADAVAAPEEIVKFLSM